MTSYRAIPTVALLALLGQPLCAGAQDGAATAATGTFSGSFRGSSFSSANDPFRFSGSAEITPATNGKLGVYQVTIRLAMSGANPNVRMANVMQWGLSPGRCGARPQPMVPPSELPPLELRAAGTATMTWEGRLNLAANASYHAMVFYMGVRQEDIVACVNLKYTEPKS